jgi:hypothetical protein
MFISTALHALQVALDTASHQRENANDDVGFADALDARLAVGAVRVITALRADQLVIDATGHSIGTENGVGLADAFVAVEATLAIRVVAALRADELVVDATGYQTVLAENDVRLTEPIDARGALAALVGFAAFIAIHTFDRDIGGRPEHAAELILRTDGDTCVHPDVTEFARVVAEERRANAFDAPLARVAVVVVAAFLAYAGAAEQPCRTIGRAGPAIGRIVLQVFAHAFATGLTLGAIVQGRATESSRNADAVAAFLAGDVAAGVITDAASELGRRAADIGFFIALARSAA